MADWPSVILQQAAAADAVRYRMPNLVAARVQLAAQGKILALRRDF